MDWLKDERTQCWSFMTSMRMDDYLKLVRLAHQDRGGIEGQRDIVRTTSGKRIRERMISDIHTGAVLPPVVLGCVLPPKEYAKLPLKEGESVLPILGQGPGLAIIDGMQRTGAMIEAAVRDPRALQQQVRVEFWLAQSVGAMVYRMLVLNTGQVPWTLARQLSVVYAPLLDEITENVPNLDRMLGVDKGGRRVGPAQFSSDALVELYLAFSLRKTNVDTKESLSDEFSKLDFVDNLSRRDFQGQFYETLDLLCSFDVEFSRYNPPKDGAERYARGRNIFDSQPARIGFVTAIAQYALGRPGAEREESDVAKRFLHIKQSAAVLIGKLQAMNDQQLGEFLALGVLREILNVRTGQVGRFERLVFFEAFKALIEEDFGVRDMEQCWRSH